MANLEKVLGPWCVCPGGLVCAGLIPRLLCFCAPCLLPSLWSTRNAGLGSSALLTPVLWPSRTLK